MDEQQRGHKPKASLTTSQNVTAPKLTLHNGEVYYYKHGHSPFNAREFDAVVERFKSKGTEDIEAFEKAMKEFEGRFGIKWTKL